MGIFGGNNKPAITNPFATHSEGSDFDSDDVPGHHEDEEDPDGLLSSKMALLLHEPSPMIAARKKATHYDIRATGGRKVGKLCLFKTAYKLGEEKIPTPQEHVDNTNKNNFKPSSSDVDPSKG